MHVLWNLTNHGWQPFIIWLALVLSLPRLRIQLEVSEEEGNQKRVLKFYRTVFAYFVYVDERHIQGKFL